MKERFDNVNASEFGSDLVKLILHDELTGECYTILLSDLYAYGDSIFLQWREGMPDCWRGNPWLAVPNGVADTQMNYNGRFWVEPFSKGWGE